MTFTPYSCFVLYFSVYYHIPYWLFIICSLLWFSNLLPLSFSHCPLHQKYFPVSPHYASAICNTQKCWPTMFFPIVLLWIYLINHILHFLSFPFLSPTSLMHTFFCASPPRVRISSHMKHLSLKLHWLLPPNHSHQTYWLATRYWELTTVHTLPCINSIVQQPSFFFDSWP